MNAFARSIFTPPPLNLSECPFCGDIDSNAEVRGCVACCLIGDAFAPVAEELGLSQVDFMEIVA